MSNHLIGWKLAQGLIDRVSATAAHLYQFVPIAFDGDSLTILTLGRLPTIVREDLSQRLRLPLVEVHADDMDAFFRHLEFYYPNPDPWGDLDRDSRIDICPSKSPSIEREYSKRLILAMADGPASHVKILPIRFRGEIRIIGKSNSSDTEFVTGVLARCLIQRFKCLANLDVMPHTTPQFAAVELPWPRASLTLLVQTRIESGAETLEMRAESA
jgi:hypothetical protein